MKSKKYLILLLTLVSHYIYSQDSIVVKGVFHNNSRFANVLIKKFAIGSFNIAATPIKDNTFTIKIPATVPEGVYRFQYSQTNFEEYIDIIINGKEKEIIFEIDALVDTHKRKPIFTASVENQNWYNYIKTSQTDFLKIEALRQALLLYPASKDKIVEVLKKEVEQQIATYESKEIQFVSQNTNQWSALMVKNSPVYLTTAIDDWRILDFNKQETYWDKIDTNNPKLINTPLYSEHILNYLKYYLNPEMQFGKEEIMQGLKKSVDTIMKKFSANPTTKEFAVKYLQMGFKEIGQEEILQYIDDQYGEIVAQCQDETNNSDKAALDKRMAAYAAMKKGVKAPNIIFEKKILSPSVSVTDLYAIEATQTLVVFWASWCPHCMEELPKVNTWAATNPNTKVVAISLDEDKTTYETAIQQFPNILHYTDLKKWEGKAAKDYYIYGTPTFILLDKEKRVLGKYSNLEAIEKVK